MILIDPIYLTWRDGSAGVNIVDTTCRQINRYTTNTPSHTVTIQTRDNGVNTLLQQQFHHWENKIRRPFLQIDVLGYQVSSLRIAFYL